MNNKLPHIVQYQGSKRLLAHKILHYIPQYCNNFIEPFAGMAAMSIATASRNRAKHFYINDINKPLIDLLQEAIISPEKLLSTYTAIWNDQFSFPDGHVQHFYKIRDDFNSGNKSPANMLYLLARCVKGAVRYGKDGKFNQSPDKRRHGTTPQNLRKNILHISNLLINKTTFSALDYREILEYASKDDIVYMDPPYQGVSNVRDNRYFSGIDFNAFVSAVDFLNQKGINFVISYDGKCGTTNYGKDLPEELECTKILLNAGLSTQATFLGKREVTFEALYISKKLTYLLNEQIDLFGDVYEY